MRSKLLRNTGFCVLRDTKGILRHLVGDRFFGYPQSMCFNPLSFRALSVTLLAVWAGACTPAEQSELVFSIEPGLFRSSSQRDAIGAKRALGPGKNSLRVLTPTTLEEGLASILQSGASSSRRIHRLNSETTDITPSVSCVGLNIMGVNISSAASLEGSKAWKQYKEDVLSGDTCSYPGKVSNTVSVDEGGVITVEVPFGADRVIQLVGYAGTECGQAISGESLLDATAVPGAYELGRSVTNLMSATPTVDLQFDLEVLDAVDTNEEASTVDEFVPDIRCQVKGEPEQQYETLKELVIANTPEPTPTEVPEEEEFCEAGTYLEGENCVPVGEGYWSDGTDDQRYACTNAPTNAAYDTTNSTTSNCSWACNSGYAENAGGTACEELCAAGTYLSGGGCVAAGLGYYADGTDNLRYACTNKDPNSYYTGANETSADCAWTCNLGYTQEMAGCIASASAQTLECASGKALVGIYGNTGAIFDSIGIKCQNISAGKPTGSISDSAETVGGAGGSPSAPFVCSSDQVVHRLTGYNGLFYGTNSALSMTVGCIDLGTSAMTSSSQYGGGAGSATSGTPQAYDFVCPSGQYAYGITAEDGPFVGAVMGILCRP